MCVEAWCCQIRSHYYSLQVSIYHSCTSAIPNVISKQTKTCKTFVNINFIISILILFAVDAAKISTFPLHPVACVSPRLHGYLHITLLFFSKPHHLPRKGHQGRCKWSWRVHKACSIHDQPGMTAGMAGAIGVIFLAQGSNNGRKPQLSFSFFFFFFSLFPFSFPFLFLLFCFVRIYSWSIHKFSQRETLWNISL